MSIVELDKYKTIQQSKVIVEDLTAIIGILNSAVRGLKAYNYYWPVRELMIGLRDAKAILDIHKNHHEQLVKANGKQNEE